MKKDIIIINKFVGEKLLKEVLKELVLLQLKNK